MNIIIQKLAVKIFNNLNDTSSLDVDREIYIHAIELTIHEGLNYLLVLLLAAMINLMVESIIYIVLFSIIRRYTGGYHAKTYLKCMIIYLVFYLVFVGFYFLASDQYMKIVLVIFMIASNYIYKISPVQHVNNPLSIIEKHKYRRISLTVLFVYILLSLILMMLHSKITYIVEIIVIFDAFLIFLLKHSEEYIED